MQDNLTAQVGLAIVYGAASGLMALLLRVEKAPAIAWWALALFLFAADAAVSAAILAFDLPSLARGISWLALGGGAVAGLVGALAFFGRRAAPGVFLLAAMVVVASVSRALPGVDEWAAQLIVFSAIAAALVWTGGIAFRAGVVGGAGRWVGSSAFLGAGLYAAVWPWIAHTSAAAHFEFYFDMAVLLWGAMGVLLMHFDRAREQMRELAAQELVLRDQLAQAERLEALGRLAAGVAHDFNNVLSIVVNGSEVVLRQLEDRPLAAAQLRVVLEAAQGAAGFTRQLLSLGRRRLPGSDPARVMTALDNALRIVKPSLSSLVTIEVEGGLPEVTVCAGEGQLEQILVNLVLNGADAMPEGGVLVIRVERPVDAPERVRLVVRDQGCGMDSATRARIFEPFFTTKSAARGTGLGLTTVQAIVAQLGGRIDVASTPRGGSAFTVELPTCPSVPPAVAQGATPAAEARSRRGSGDATGGARRRVG